MSRGVVGKRQHQRQHDKWEPENGRLKRFVVEITGQMEGITQGPLVEIQMIPMRSFLPENRSNPPPSHEHSEHHQRKDSYPPPRPSLE